MLCDVTLNCYLIVDSYFLKPDLYLGTDNVGGGKKLGKFAEVQWQSRSNARRVPSGGKFSYERPDRLRSLSTELVQTDSL